MWTNETVAGERERKQGLSGFIRMLLDDDLLEFSAVKISHSKFQQPQNIPAQALLCNLG